MKSKKLAALFVAATLVTLTFSGCGEKPVTKTETLKYVMMGPAAQEDQQIVFDEFNKKLQEKLPGVKVDFEIINGADYKQRFLLMQAGGEQLDIAGTYGLDFVAEVQNKSFIALDELIEKYAPETKKAYPEWLFDYMKVDGKIYGIPAYQQLDTPNGLYIPKKFADKYLDVEAFTEALQTKNYDVLFPMITDYAQKLTENGEIGYGLDCDMICYTAKEKIKSFTLTPKGEKDYEVGYVFFDDMYDKYFEYADKWYKAGYIRKDVMTVTNKNVFEGYAMFSQQVNPINDKKYSEDFVIIPFNKDLKIPSTSVAGGVAVTSSCKAPEKAVQLLNLLHTDVELFNLLTYGIEGKHYNKIDESHIEVPYASNQGSSTDKYGLYKWIVGNTEIAYLTQYDSDEHIDWVFNKVNKASLRSDFIGFVFNTTNIQDKIDQINAICGQYENALKYGTTQDWKATYNEWKAKCNAAGIEDCISELQKQVDEFLK